MLRHVEALSRSKHKQFCCLHLWASLQISLSCDKTSTRLAIQSHLLGHTRPQYLTVTICHIIDHMQKKCLRCGLLALHNQSKEMSRSQHTGHHLHPNHPAASNFKRVGSSCQHFVQRCSKCLGIAQQHQAAVYQHILPFECCGICCFRSEGCCSSCNFIHWLIEQSTHDSEPSLGMASGHQLEKTCNWILAPPWIGEQKKSYHPLTSVALWTLTILDALHRYDKSPQSSLQSASNLLSNGKDKTSRQFLNSRDFGKI